MANTLSPAMAFGQQDSSYTPQATISLSDTNLMTPDPTSPESSYNVKEEQGEDGEPRKPTKKRKSWGQELPTPKTNLPPRYDIAITSNDCASTYDIIGNEQRRKMKRSSGVSSESCETVKQPNHHESASDKKSRSLKARSSPSNSRMPLSSNN